MSVLYLLYKSGYCSIWVNNKYESGIIQNNHWNEIPWKIKYNKNVNGISNGISKINRKIRK